DDGAHTGRLVCTCIRETDGVAFGTPAPPPMRVRATVLAAVFAASMVSAQAPVPDDPCPVGAAVGTLEGRNVRATLYNTGNIGYGYETGNGDGYLAPLRGADAGRSPLYASSLWLGGRVG